MRNLFVFLLLIWFIFSWMDWFFKRTKSSPKGSNWRVKIIWTRM